MIAGNVNRVSFNGHGWVTPMRDLLQEAYRCKWYGESPKAVKLIKSLEENSFPYVELAYDVNGLSAKVRSRHSSDSFSLSNSQIKEQGFLAALKNLADFVEKQNLKIVRKINKNKK